MWSKEILLVAEKDKNKDSALKVQKGIEQPSSFNPEAAKRIKKSKKEIHEVKEYVEGILSGNRTILSKAITLVESSLSEHQMLAQQIIEKCLPSFWKLH